MTESQLNEEILLAQKLLKRTIVLLVNKCFYSSGFLYHPASAQILLQQDEDSETQAWTLIGSSCPNQSGTENFRLLLQKQLSLDLESGSIHPVYEYHQTDPNQDHYISYAEVKKLADFPKKQSQVFAWFTMKEISKLSLSIQTKQDIVVGQRVIDSENRRKAGELTIG